jgi:hypothetical protein
MCGISTTLILFPGRLSLVHGRYTEAAVQSCSQLIGSQGKQLDMLFMTKVAEQADYYHGEKLEAYEDHVLKFVNMYQKNNLWDIVPKRKHKAFPKMFNIVHVKNPEKLNGRLRKYSMQLQKEHDMYSSFK